MELCVSWCSWGSVAGLIRVVFPHGFDFCTPAYVAAFVCDGEFVISWLGRWVLRFFINILVCRPATVVLLSDVKGTAYADACGNNSADLHFNGGGPMSFCVPVVHFFAYARGRCVQN